MKQSTILFAMVCIEFAMWLYVVYTIIAVVPVPSLSFFNLVAIPCSMVFVGYIAISLRRVGK